MLVVVEVLLVVVEEVLEVLATVEVVLLVVEEALEVLVEVEVLVELANDSPGSKIPWAYTSIHT